jgi:transposase
MKSSTATGLSIQTIAVDLAKEVFQLACADQNFRIVQSLRLKRTDFLKFWNNLKPVHVVMEACGSAHHFGRWLTSLGHRVSLLPAQYVRAYVRRNKTDAADCGALLEAIRASDIKTVPIKTQYQQIIQLMHRTRQQWQHDRTARINLARGMLREFGIAVPEGAETGQAVMRAQLANETLDPNIRSLLAQILEEIEGFEQQVVRLDRRLKAFSENDPILVKLESLPGIGWITATALRASIGDIQRFKNGRTLSNWIGFTPKEHSSGSTRTLGRMSKRGDVYLRMLMIQGARSVLAHAIRNAQLHRPLDALRSWAMKLRDRRGFNKAAVGLANKLARIVWATWTNDSAFNGNHAQAPKAVAA